MTGDLSAHAPVLAGDAAGIGSRISTGGAAELPQDIDAAAGVSLSAGPDYGAAVIRATPPFALSGLAGLAEPVRGLGGELAAGAVEPQGFRLRVVVLMNGRP